MMSNKMVHSANSNQVVTMWSQSFSNQSLNCLKFVSRLCKICVKVVSKFCQSCVKVLSKSCQSCLKIVSLLQGRTKWPGKKLSSNLLVIVRELVHESLLVTSIRWCDQCDIDGSPLCQLPPILKLIQIYKSKGARSFGKYIYKCLNTY